MAEEDLHLDELGGTIKVLLPPSKAEEDSEEEWDERCQRWNLFTEDEIEIKVILVPQDTQDVITIVNWARKNNQTNIGVRSGGHGFFSSASVVVDMREGFSFVSLDDEESTEEESNTESTTTTTRIATIGMGNTLKQVDDITSPYHMPLGVVFTYRMWFMFHWRGWLFNEITWNVI